MRKRNKIKISFFLYTAIYHPPTYFDNQYEDEWITDPLTDEGKERFFTALLVEYTQGSYLKYNKHKLNKAYLHEKTKYAILNVIGRVNMGGKANSL